jgi:hypothetical protein
MGSGEARSRYRSEGYGTGATLMPVRRSQKHSEDYRQAREFVALPRRGVLFSHRRHEFS